MTDPAQQFEWFNQAVDLLGGPKRAADAIGIAERTVVAIRGGDRRLGEGVLGKTRTALNARAHACIVLSGKIEHGGALISPALVPIEQRESYDLSSLPNLMKR